MSNIVKMPTTRHVKVDVFSLRSDTPHKKARKIIEAGLESAWKNLNEIEDYYYARGPEPFLRLMQTKPRRPRRAPPAPPVQLKSIGDQT